MFSSLRHAFIRVALGRLAPATSSTKIPVLLIPTTTVSLQSVQDLAQILTLCQNVFIFYVTPAIDIRRTAESTIRFSPQKPTIGAAAYEKELGRYITQFDYYPQIEQFLEGPKNLGSFSERYIYEYGRTETIVIGGKERFVWDEDNDPYTITGVYEEDGWTALYDDRPDTTDGRQNICLISLEKLRVDEASLSNPLIRERGLEGYPPHRQRQLVQRVYLAHNIAHFLLARVFHCNPSEYTTEAHADDCIMDLNWAGGLDSLTASGNCQP